MFRSIAKCLRLVLPASALLGVPSCSAPDVSPLATPAIAATPARAAPAGPALWKVADADTTIYLFGTVHALPKDVPWMRGAIPAALASADTVVTEVDTGAADMAAMQKVVLAKALLPQGQTLRALLTPDQRTAYEAGLAKLGLAPEALDRFEPWYVALMLTMIPLQKAGINGDNGVEKALGTAAGDGKRHAALETVEYQLSIFDELPQPAQVDYMMQVIAGSDQVQAELAAMVRSWLAGDADGLAALMNDDMAGDEALMQRLLYGRNRAWAGWIADRLEKPGTVFVAVGAGHLAGPESVQADLAARGIAVTRVQ